MTATDTGARLRPESWRGVDLLKLVAVAGQFALLVFLFRHYELESPAAGRVMLLALGGFVVQLLLPLAWRKWRHRDRRQGRRSPHGRCP